MKKITFKLYALLLASLCSWQLKAQSNQYLDFDGVDDFVTTNNASALVAGAPGYTMTGWFYCNALSYGQGMMGLRATSCGFYMIMLNNGSIECRYVNSANTLFQYVAPNFTVVPQTWQHYAWVYDGSNVRLYLNGNQLGSAAANGIITNTTTQFAIGKSILSGFNFVYNGRIDEVTLWNKALSATEIQDMVANELTGTEPNLQLYYKFNQGVPGGNNTSIPSVISEVNSPTYDGNFNNFLLDGPTSNFNGTVNNSFQAISFPQIAPQLISTPSITLNATASSGLPVVYSILSGPATVNGNVLTITGAGVVEVAADQPGNAQYNPAVQVVNTFDVLDPATTSPTIEPRNPLDGSNVYMSSLSAIDLASIVTIPHPTLFNVQNVSYVINGTTINATDHGNNHYTAIWTPTAYGPQSIQIVSSSNYNATSTVTVNINVVAPTANLDSVQAFSGILIDSSTPSKTVEGILPTYVDAYDSVMAVLTVSCPTGGCGPWDRVASIDARGKDGKWFEIIRYITPYGVPCSHKINLMDYASILQGKVTFRVNCATLDNGFVYQLRFDFKEGTPQYKYSRVSQVWKDIYPFGDMANLQPVPMHNHTYLNGAVASKLKLVSTGHGWGSLNTGNAAEFYNATHNIAVNGTNTFTQNNWTICSPNPDGCSPQNGTWTYNRAGWCPGAIARPFDYDLTPYVAAGNLALGYQFQTSYTDQCHPSNPNCVTGVTCADCADGFNPVLDVNCNLITYFNNATFLGVNEVNSTLLNIYPNPSKGIFNLTQTAKSLETFNVDVFDLMGSSVKSFEWDGSNKVLDLSAFAKGVYILKAHNDKTLSVKRLIVQ
jgi:hypothetical protein